MGGREELPDISLWISSGTKETPEEMTNMILQTFDYDAWRL